MSRRGHPAELGDRRFEAHQLAIAAAAGLHLDLALTQALGADDHLVRRSEENTYELQSLSKNTYSLFCVI
jgi:hypothetical protein